MKAIEGDLRSGSQSFVDDSPVLVTGVGLTNAAAGVWIANTSENLGVILIGGPELKNGGSGLPIRVGDPPLFLPMAKLSNLWAKALPVPDDEDNPTFGHTLGFAVL